MNTKWKIVICLILAFTIGLALPITAYAHGARITYTVSTTIDIVASYDSGEPMAGAQVAVYAPDDPTTPRLTGVCDDEGRFSFTPDSSESGTWDVQVRQAGHGDIVHIPIGGSSEGNGGTGSYTALQIVLMAVCVVWGSVGTALYFLRRKA
jgi:nickel transport protein